MPTLERLAAEVLLECASPDRIRTWAEQSISDVPGSTSLVYDLLRTNPQELGRSFLDLIAAEFNYTPYCQASVDAAVAVLRYLCRAALRGEVPVPSVDRAVKVFDAVWSVAPEDADLDYPSAVCDLWNVFDWYYDHGTIWQHSQGFQDALAEFLRSTESKGSA